MCQASMTRRENVRTPLADNNAMENPTHSNLLIFDDGLGQWGPMTDLRPVFDLRTGARTTRQRIEQVLGQQAIALVVPAAMETWVAQEQPDLCVNGLMDNTESWLVVNGRWSGVTAVEPLCQLPLDCALIQADGQLVAAHLCSEQAQSWIRNPGSSPPFETIDIHRLESQVLLARPWHILDHLDTCLRTDLDTFDIPPLDGVKRDAVCFGDHSVSVAPDATLQPKVIFNAQHGPIVVESEALIGAMAVLEGPCYIGRASQVACHAHIRPHTVVGPVCKVAGEISHSVIQGYANKGHHGYLGHALVGQWVNLGAATNVSNLKNTYGPIRMQLARTHAAIDTGRMYLGPLIGDYVRTGIGSRLLTGACVGTGAMIAQSGYGPKFIDRFCFLTDSGSQAYDIEKFLATAQKMMDRRNQPLMPALRSRLIALAQSDIISNVA